MVDIVDTTGDRGAKIVRWNIPVYDSVMRLQQRAIEHAHRFRITEIYRFLTYGIVCCEGFKLWQIRDHIRPRAAGQGRGLCRRGCRHHPAAVADPEAAIAPRRRDQGIRDAGTPAGAGAGRDGTVRHQD